MARRKTTRRKTSSSKKSKMPPVTIPILILIGLIGLGVYLSFQPSAKPKTTSNSLYRPLKPLPPAPKTTPKIAQQAHQLTAQNPHSEVVELRTPSQQKQKSVPVVFLPSLESEKPEENTESSTPVIPIHPVTPIQTPTDPITSKDPSVVPVLPAQPVQTDIPKTDLDFATWQVAMERRHFSCGTIDGDVGMRSRRALIQLQKSAGLPTTGTLDEATRLYLGKPGEPFTQYTVTAEDMGKVQPTPATWKAKANVTYLGYNTPLEMLSEKFHTTPKFLQTLNPQITNANITAGTQLLAPNLAPSIPLPKAGMIQIILSETTLLVYDTDKKLIACFPCSIAQDKNKRPNGELKVAVVAPNPNYTFSPTLFPEAAAQENITGKIIIPPGPNNPVGEAWIGLSLPGYGIHGTPDATAISRTGSHGCFRLANWNAAQLVKIVQIGVPVNVVEK